MHTCYKIYGYFEFQFFTYHLSSVLHSATLNVISGILNTVWTIHYKLLVHAYIISCLLIYHTVSRIHKFRQLWTKIEDGKRLNNLDYITVDSIPFCIFLIFVFMVNIWDYAGFNFKFVVYIQCISLRHITLILQDPKVILPLPTS